MKCFRTRNTLEVVRLRLISEKGDNGELRIKKLLHLGDRIQKRGKSGREETQENTTLSEDQGQSNEEGELGKSLNLEVRML